jgi:gliding motility-associated-like protein
VIGSDANGCKDTAQVTVNVNPLPVVNAGIDQSVCKLNSTQLQATGASTYTWTPAATLSCNSCGNPVASPTTNTTYTVTGTDGNGCTNTDDVTVSIYPQPVIDAGADQTICNGSSVQLQATGGVAYVWSPATSLSCSTCPNPLASPSNDITYTVVGTDANGCNDSDKVNISVIQMQPFSVSPGDTLCEGESVQLSASGGSQYIWSPSYGLNNSTISNPVATPSVTTTYEVVIKQGDCFSDTNKVTILVHPKPTVNAGQDQNVIAGSSVNLFAQTTNTDYYAWTPADELSCSDCSSPIATPKQTTTYKVTASNEYGCSADDDLTIFVTCDNSQIFVPNTFTPNGDGNNDRFYPQGKGVSTIQRFRIYNRWGQLVYDVQNIQTNQELQGWDGTYKNEALKPDVYVYIIDATCYSGAPMQIKGDVSLIR